MDKDEFTKKMQALKEKAQAQRAHEHSEASDAASDDSHPIDDDTLDDISNAGLKPSEMMKAITEHIPMAGGKLTLLDIDSRSDQNSDGNSNNNFSTNFSVNRSTNISINLIPRSGLMHENVVGFVANSISDAGVSTNSGVNSDPQNRGADSHPNSRPISVQSRPASVQNQNSVHNSTRHSTHNSTHNSIHDSGHNSVHSQPSVSNSLSASARTGVSREGTLDSVQPEEIAVIGAVYNDDMALNEEDDEENDSIKMFDNNRLISGPDITPRAQTPDPLQVGASLTGRATPPVPMHAPNTPNAPHTPQTPGSGSKQQQQLRGTIKPSEMLRMRTPDVMNSNVMHDIEEEGDEEIDDDGSVNTHKSKQVIVPLIDMDTLSKNDLALGLPSSDDFLDSAGVSFHPKHTHHHHHKDNEEAVGNSNDNDLAIATHDDIDNNTANSAATTGVMGSPINTSDGVAERPSYFKLGIPNPDDMALDPTYWLSKDMKQLDEHEKRAQRWRRLHQHALAQQKADNFSVKVKHSIDEMKEEFLFDMFKALEPVNDSFVQPMIENAKRFSQAAVEATENNKQCARAISRYLLPRSTPKQGIHNRNVKLPQLMPAQIQDLISMSMKTLSTIGSGPNNRPNDPSSRLIYVPPSRNNSNEEPVVTAEEEAMKKRAQLIATKIADMEEAMVFERFFEDHDDQVIDAMMFLVASVEIDNKDPDPLPDEDEEVEEDEEEKEKSSVHESKSEVDADKSNAESVEEHSGADDEVKGSQQDDDDDMGLNTSSNVINNLQEFSTLTLHSHQQLRKYYDDLDAAEAQSMEDEHDHLFQARLKVLKKRDRDSKGQSAEHSKEHSREHSQASSDEDSEAVEHNEEVIDVLSRICVAIELAADEEAEEEEETAQIPEQQPKEDLYLSGSKNAGPVTAVEPVVLADLDPEECMDSRCYGCEITLRIFVNDEQRSISGLEDIQAEDIAILLQQQLHEPSSALQVGELTRHIIDIKYKDSHKRVLFKSWESYWVHNIHPVFFGYHTQKNIKKPKPVDPDQMHLPPGIKVVNPVSLLPTRSQETFATIKSKEKRREAMMAKNADGAAASIKKVIDTVDNEFADINDSSQLKLYRPNMGSLTEKDIERLRRTHKAFEKKYEDLMKRGLVDGKRMRPDQYEAMKERDSAYRIYRTARQRWHHANKVVDDTPQLQLTEVSNELFDSWVQEIKEEAHEKLIELRAKTDRDKKLRQQENAIRAKFQAIRAYVISTLIKSSISPVEIATAFTTKLDNAENLLLDFKAGQLNPTKMEEVTEHQRQVKQTTVSEQKRTRKFFEFACDWVDRINNAANGVMNSSRTQTPGSARQTPGQGRPPSTNRPASKQNTMRPFTQQSRDHQLKSTRSDWMMSTRTTGQNDDVNVPVALLKSDFLKFLLAYYTHQLNTWATKAASMPSRQGTLKEGSVTSTMSRQGTIKEGSLVNMSKDNSSFDAGNASVVSSTPRMNPADIAGTPAAQLTAIIEMITTALNSFELQAETFAATNISAAAVSNKQQQLLLPTSELALQLPILPIRIGSPALAPLMSPSTTALEAEQLQAQIATQVNHAKKLKSQELELLSHMRWVEICKFRPEFLTCLEKMETSDEGKFARNELVQVS
jgi:hypothetical protein